MIFGDGIEEIHIHASEPVFTSGVVCKILNIPVWVLKQLDKEDVVCPKRTKGKTRLYSKQDLGKLKHAWYYIKTRRVNVNGVKIILEMEERYEVKGGGEEGEGEE